MADDGGIRKEQRGYVKALSLVGFVGGVYWHFSDFYFLAGDNILKIMISAILVGLSVAFLIWIAAEFFFLTYNSTLDIASRRSSFLGKIWAVVVFLALVSILVDLFLGGYFILDPVILLLGGYD